MTGARLRLLLFLLLAPSACTTYEYEEEVFLELEGSGRIRVSGSRGILEAIHGIVDPSVLSVAESFRSDGVEVIAVRETKRDQRSFFHVQMRFDQWKDLCRIPPFRERRCRLSISELEQVLELEAPRPVGELPTGMDPSATLALRFHLPSTVRYHNSPSGIERGNILSWERELGAYFDEGPFALEVRYGRESILAATMRIVLLAAGLVASTIGIAIYWMVRKGRRQLEADGTSGS